MLDKDSLEIELQHLIDRLRGEKSTLIALLPFKATSQADYAIRCLDLKHRLNSATDDELVELQKEFLSLEQAAHRHSVLLNTVPSVALLYVVATVLFLGLTSADLAGFVNHVLGVRPPEKLIALGIFGAFTYLATTTLTDIRAQHAPSAFNRTMEFSLRVGLAIIVPVILVVVFFNESGATREDSIAPELLSFACGYSVKLVVELFNKIVEKGSKLINAL